jgi:radical SAM superfamily enzyme YgiQ (UPF0313 family)
MIKYEEPVIRPPSESDSLILQATIGCSHNRCAFCIAYKEKNFRARPVTELAAEIEWASRSLPKVHRVFLGDGDALALSTRRLLAILKLLQENFPDLRRVSAYASPGNFRHKSVSELKELKEAGLSLLYVGLESGDDEVLRRVRKGASSAELVDLCALPQQAGMRLFVTVVLGLGGPRLSMRHARETARVLSQIKPRFAAALTLMLPRHESGFAQIFDDPEWRMLNATEMLVECRELVKQVDSNGILFYANHASNYVPLRGTLQKDKARLIEKLDKAIADPGCRMPEYFRGL